MGQTSGPVGIDLFPLLPCFPGEVAGVPTSRQPLFLLGVIRPEERDSGKWRGALDPLGGLPGVESSSPQSRARASRTVSCFHFRAPASCSERPVPKHSRQPPLTPSPDVWAVILWVYV